MQKLEDFEDFIKMEAISTYLKSFGYKAKVCNNILSVEVQDVDSTFHTICTWEGAREFIKVRAEA
jgi:hypothetical protein